MASPLAAPDPEPDFRGQDSRGRRCLMVELVRTNDPALISVVEGLLVGAGIPYHVADRHMSVLEGSIHAIQARILVPDMDEAGARHLLTEAELGSWLRPLN